MTTNCTNCTTFLEKKTKSLFILRKKSIFAGCKTKKK